MSWALEADGATVVGALLELEVVRSAGLDGLAELRAAHPDGLVFRTLGGVDQRDGRQRTHEGTVDQQGSLPVLLESPLLDFVVQGEAVAHAACGNLEVFGRASGVGPVHRAVPRQKPQLQHLLQHSDGVVPGADGGSVQGHAQTQLRVGGALLGAAILVACDDEGRAVSEDAVIRTTAVMVTCDDLDRGHAGVLTVGAGLHRYGGGVNADVSPPAAQVPACLGDTDGDKHEPVASRCRRSAAWRPAGPFQASR